MIKKSAFVKDNLEDILSNEDFGNRHFRGEDGERVSSEEYERRVGLLEDSLDGAYDIKLGKEKKGGSYLASALRLSATLAYATAPYLFFGFPGVGGFGMTGTGIGLSALADYIDMRNYKSLGQISNGDIGKIAAESIGTKVLSYLPIGTGLIDIYRGRKKFESAADKHRAPLLDDAVDYALSDFERKLKVKEKDGRKIIPIGEFRDRNYIHSERREAA